VVSRGGQEALAAEVVVEEVEDELLVALPLDEELSVEELLLAGTVEVEPERESVR